MKLALEIGSYDEDFIDALLDGTDLLRILIESPGNSNDEDISDEDLLAELDNM